MLARSKQEKLSGPTSLMQSQIRTPSSPYLWLPQCPNNCNDCSPGNYCRLSSIPIKVSVLQISGQEPWSGWYTLVIEFLSVTATYTPPTHLMNNEWAAYATYSSPTSLFWPGSCPYERSINRHKVCPDKKLRVHRHIKEKFGCITAADVKVSK